MRKSRERDVEVKAAPAASPSSSGARPGAPPRTAPRPPRRSPAARARRPRRVSVRSGEPNATRKASERLPAPICSPRYSSKTSAPRTSSPPASRIASSSSAAGHRLVHDEGEILEERRERDHVLVEHALRHRRGQAREVELERRPARSRGPDAPRRPTPAAAGPSCRDGAAGARPARPAPPRAAPRAACRRLPSRRRTRPRGRPRRASAPPAASLPEGR